MKTTEDALIIKLSKRKMILLLLGCVAFIATSVWLIIIADTQTRFNSLFVKTVSFVGIIFFGICFLYGVYKLFDKKPGLLIDNKGIQDNSSAIGLTQINWEDILAIDIGAVKSTRFLLIIVKNPERFIEHGNRLKQKLLLYNYKMFGTPITISSNSLKCNFDELYKIVEEKFRYFQSKNTL